MCANNEDRDGRNVYRLHDGEKTFLRDGDPGSEHPSRHKKNIQEKTQLLLKRFEALFEDIQLLYENGYLNTREWRDKSIELLGIESDTPEPFDERYFYSVYDTRDEVSPVVAFGHGLGKMTARITSRPRVLKRDDVLTDIVWGFTEGIAPQPRGGESNQQFTRDCTETLEHRAKNKDIIYKQAASDTIDTIERMGKQFGRAEERTTEILNTLGITSETWLTKAVIDEIKSDLGIRDRRVTPLAMKVDSVEEAITEERVREIVETNNLRAKQQLLNTVERDCDQIERIDGGDVSPSAVLLTIPSDSDTTTREIAKEFGPTKYTLAPVVRIGLFLAGRRDMNSETLNGPPVLTTDDSDTEIFGEEKWSLHPYGRIVQHRLRTRVELSGLPVPTVGEARPLRDISEQTIDAALAELEPAQDPPDEYREDSATTNSSAPSGDKEREDDGEDD